ncbi:HpcH/HpaI aldolase/citrate lyase family protein [Pseudonocardia alaniniphila]|uniref:CoA ester lyase n=1 Tax=Pseudonocardia alaniniphila TaxID=75291 RepID=A0ABS9TUH7_9PSEU|nr:CoA ester lyase [Pseudonocardia alaniniphila]MCH6172212.1 CoA ester lyase [Pseudonocardia alaniniphila]
MKRISGVDARTWLLAPGDRPDRFSTPESREADALVLDLANNIAPENVELARHAVAKYLSGGGNAWVRVNSSDTDLYSGDLRAVVACPGLRGIVLPRTESADQVRAVKAQLRAGVTIVAMLETAAGIENADGIAASHGTLRLAFGATGLGRELGIAGGAAALLYARSRLVMASCAAGLPGPIDGPSVDVNDIIGLGEDLRHSVGLGFTGKMCVHPRQLCMTNSAFAPAPSKLAWARRVLAATRASPPSLTRVDGEVVDWQHIDDARHTVARAALFDPADAGLGEPAVRPLRNRRRRTSGNCTL